MYFFDKFHTYLDRHPRQDLLLSVVAMVIVTSILVPIIGWVGFSKLLIGGSLLMLIGLAAMTGVVGLFYLLVVYRAEWYASRLREHGYAVFIDRRMIWQMGLMIVLALFCTWVLGQALYRHYLLYTEFAVSDEGRVFFRLLIGGLVVVLWLLSSYCAVNTWRTSFRPLRRHAIAVSRGEEVDLPRIDDQ